MLANCIQEQMKVTTGFFVLNTGLSLMFMSQYNSVCCFLNPGRHLPKPAAEASHLQPSALLWKRKQGQEGVFVPLLINTVRGVIASGLGTMRKIVRLEGKEENCLHSRGTRSSRREPGI